MDPEIEIHKARLGWIAAFWVGRTRPSLGAWGEWIALGYLLTSGWDILARNWRCQQGEIDLLAFDEPWLVVVEVKTRRKDPSFPPELGLDTDKEERLRELGYLFRFEHHLVDRPLRFDLIAIETEDLRCYELRHYRAVC